MDARGSQELKDYIVEAGGTVPEDGRQLQGGGVPPIFDWVGVTAPPRPVEDEVVPEEPRSPVTRALEKLRALL